MADRTIRELVHSMSFSELRSLKDHLHACVECNGEHRGVMPERAGHAHNGVRGVGFVRIIVRGGTTARQFKGEFCWRCSCPKSGWRNVPNDIAKHCADGECVCHSSAEVY